MVLGVIEVVNKSDGAFDHGDLELLQALASSAAIAIKNAHLYEDVQEQYEVLKSTQAQLIHSEKMAALGRLAASLAHEINNPLQSVQTCITLTKEELEQVDQTKALDRYLNIVENEIDRISTIVHRMRDFYRPSSSGMQAVQLHQVLDSVLALTDKQLQQSNITVETRWADDLPDVTANPDHLRQIFLNLILNAIDAMPRGGLLQITTAVDTLICATDEGQAPGVRVDFSDTGEGIPAQIQTRIFEPFFTTKSGGSGLGLSTSYGIIEAHQGQITVSSEPGRETTFSIILPLEQVANRPDNPEKET
jgi:two-component system NtrC family sensor kinase